LGVRDLGGSKGPVAHGADTISPRHCDFDRCKQNGGEREREREREREKFIDNQR